MALPMIPAMAPIILTVLMILTNVISSYGAKLNAPKVLLPYYSSVITNFTLQVEYSPEESLVANCYRWRSTNPEIAQVQLVNSTDSICAQTAIVSAISKTPHQKATVILAENKVTGEILRTNVIVGEIVRLEIETTTRLLFLEDSPEELIARGYDSEGNIFSNLEGLSFEWSLISDNETGQEIVDAHNILRIKRFTDSHYTTPRHIAPLEAQGKQGDMILVEGIRTGSAKVSARLKDPAYKNIKPHDVRIMVIANLMLSPLEAYVLTHGQVKYRVEILKHNSLKEIEMPSKQYYLEVKDGDICSFDRKTSMATALAMGSTEVVLKDRNIIGTDFFRQPSALIHVVSPGFLVFVILPHRKWILETGREYEIYLEIYDTDSHMIYPSDNVRVVAEFDSAYLKVLFSSVNGTYHIVRALIKGDTVIDGTLVSVIDKQGQEHAIRPEVKQSQDVEIYDPIVVTPALLIFPWDPVTRCHHRFVAKATGGSGEYVWTMTNTSVATVDAKGKINTVGPGTTNITAADAKNSIYYGTSVVHVLPPTEIKFPLSRVEASVGTTLQLPLEVLTKLGKAQYSFTDCRQLPLNITFSDFSVFEHVAKDELTIDLPEKGCTTLTFLAKHHGHTEVVVTYQSKNVILEASVTIAAYNPLKAVDPEVEVVIGLASSKEILFNGGPQPWILDSSKFFQDLKPARQDLVRTEKSSAVATGRGVHSFVVFCRDFGEQEIHLSVGNGKTAKNQFPVTETTFIRFICARPVELHLQPLIKLNSQLPPCPLQREKNVPMPIHYAKDLELLVVVTDSSGRRFDNFSSLAIEWSVSAPNLADLLYTKDLKSQLDVHSSGKKTLNLYQTVKPHRKTGNIIITASIDWYKVSASKAFGKPLERITPAIKKSLELMLVEEAVLSPASVSVFNHPSNKVNIELRHGSGYFYLEEFKSQVLSAKYDQKGRSVQVTPLKDGTHVFTIYDICLDVTAHPVATVSVSGVGRVDVMVIDKVEVLKEVQAKVQVLDLRGEPLLASFFTLMGLKLEPASDIISLRPLQTNEGDSVTGLYTVYGAQVGHTTLTASISLPNHKVIHSAPKAIEVFPPLKLEPKNITLIIGAVLQVLAFGGPQPQSNVEFSIMDKHISTVSTGGLLEAQEIGQTKIIGKAVGTDSLTGEKVVYSQDDAIVNVIVLKGVRIHAPLTRLQTGTKIPVYALGLTENETPFSFGNTVPPLIFTWTASSREVLKLQSVYSKSGIQPLSENNFAQQAVAMETGHATIKLKVQVTPGSHLQLYGDSFLTDEVQIQVFEKLALLSPTVCHGQIRITPNTDTFLKTNRDIAARVSYYVINDSQDTPVIRVLDNGQLRSGSAPGNAFLHVVSEEEFGINQTLVILVKVKPVSYLMINSDTTILTTSANQLTAVPLGSTLLFSVSFHDDVGDEFYATNIQLGIRCSRYDLLHVSNGVDNNTLLVRTGELGHTVLKVWNKNKPSMADYVNIPVGHAIAPTQATVTLGSIICFHSPITTESGIGGTWISKSSALEIEESSGISTAKSVGRATIIYTFSAFTSTKTEVVIEPIKSISIDQGLGYLTNSAVKGRNPFFQVSFTSSGTSIIGTNCSSVVVQSKFSPSYIPYTCQLELLHKTQDIFIEELFGVKPHFDVEKGLHGCLVQVNSPENSIQRLAVFESNITLSVRVLSSPGQPEVFSAPLTLNFIPAFYVHNAELLLTTSSPQALLKVSAAAKVVPDIEISTSDLNVIQVLAPEVDLANSNVINYPVKLVDSALLWNKEKLDIYVEASHRRTGYKVKIPVLVKLIGQKPDSSKMHRLDQSWSSMLSSTVSNYQSWLIICLIVMLTAAAVLVGYHAILGPRYKASSNPNVFLNQGSLSPSQSASFIQQSTPISSPSYTGRPSPTSPKLWSVSYNQQDTRTSPYKRNLYSLSPQSKS
ncbi:nuclear pore membrane glycoprotein 210-like [Biomphalaria glabrata]|uniref:Nuclear pore membrane glycoprotein 210-like n=1 Tax=Biomphalaria glabrata TaxID=6526 RepID=A0A9W3BHU5_BIOGL|nr:nuclear pore membrane glycoprotein 210-like [Biomphalaria glabrata]